MLKDDPRQTTAIFGGTFDPIHKGHIAMARHVLSEGFAKEVIFIPSLVPPHKIGKKITSGKHRMKMIEHAIADQEDMAVSDYELQQQANPSYTWNTLRAFTTAMPKTRIKLILGMDNLLEFDNWYKITDIINTYNLLIFDRPGSRRASYVNFVHKFGPKMAEKIQNSIIDSDLEFDATTIRKHAGIGKDISSLVQPAVANYISEQGLYK